MGSPPRGRGKVDDPEGGDLVHRITPAWAGKRDADKNVPSTQKDHPRVGGEKHCTDRKCTCKKGSPPRGRGKAMRVVQSSRCLRITPAWAGKREFTSTCFKRYWDHPRVGGEKRWCIECNLAARGSPPRGRGKVVLHCGVVFDVGITPAWAGKRYISNQLQNEVKDHPRVGGEKALQAHFRRFAPGSPPRGRGKAENASTH